MKIQNLAIIFLVIILPLLMILGYYLKLQEDTLNRQSDYTAKLSSATKEAIKAYEINTVNWREKRGEERRNVNASVNTFLTSLANNLNISGTSKEYMVNYVPAVAVTMYSGYYIYSPAYVSDVLESEQGVQLYFNGTELTTDYSTNGALNDVAYKPTSGATSVRSASYTYVDSEGNEKKKTYSFTTDAAQAAKAYKHSLSNQIAYSGTYRKGTVNVTINYTLDNRIYIYGKDGSKDIQEQGCLVYFGADTKLPRIQLTSNPRNEKDITVITKVNESEYIGSNINSEILTEQIIYKENSSALEELGTFKYIYDITGEKMYYDDSKEEFFTISLTDKTKKYLNNSLTLKAGDEGCKFKSVSVLTGDGSTYKKLFQALNGRDKGKWYISLKEDSKNISEIGPGVEVIDTEIKQKRPDFGFTAIYRDYSAVSYYVEAYAFTKWIGQRLGGDIVQTRIVYNSQTKKYENQTRTLKNLFNITVDNDIEKEGSFISEHKKETMIDSINSNLNVSISNYSRNSPNEYKLPIISDEDWNQVFKNISMIAFFQGVPIGLKTYNNYAIATSTQNRDYVDPDEIFFSSNSKSYHRPYCTSLTKDEIEGNYMGYRSVEYTLRTYEQKDKIIYYYQHMNNTKTTNNSDEACYKCIINKADYERLDNINKSLLNPSQKEVLNIQIKAYKEALARERYYQNVQIAAKLGIMVRYHENIPQKVQNAGILVGGVKNMPEDQEADPEKLVQISSKVPELSTNDPYIKLRCTGWSMNPNAETRDYEQGKFYKFTESVDLYAIWEIDLSNLNWMKDYTTSVSTINIVPNGSQTDIKMIGNGKNPGKGATWTSIDSSIIKIKNFKFDYNIDFGDSFTSAGILLNIKDSNPSNEHSGVLTGYMISFNYANAYSEYGKIFRETGSNATVWKFTYNKGQNSENFDASTLTKKENLNISKSGQMEIKVTDAGYEIYANGAKLYNLIVPVSEKVGNSFGFFSAHYRHNCSNIGRFDITNIKVGIEIF